MPLTTDRIADLKALLELGAPFISVRTDSDYWLYAELFSSTCPVAVSDDTGRLVGAVIALRSQDDPDDIYVQDVMTHPDHRRQGVARALLASVAAYGTGQGCSRLYLTSEPDNRASHATWAALGFNNLAGDYDVAGVSVVRDLKGPGKDRAVYQLDL